MHRRRLLGLTLSAIAAPAAARTSDFVSRRIAVTVRGAGPDVVLIPGLASTPDVWDRPLPRLAERFRLHLVAIGGFGGQLAGDNAEGAVCGPVAADIIRYVRETGLNRPALIGHSLGGQIALRAAAAAPHEIGRVMPVDSSPFFADLLRPGATAAEIEPLARLMFQALRWLGQDALRDQARAFGLDAGPAADALFGAMGWGGGDRRTLSQALYEAMTADLRDRLPRVSAPVAVIYGLGVQADSPRRTLEPRLRAAYAALPRPARFEAITGAEHMVMMDRPGAFADAVTRFLA